MERLRRLEPVRDLNKLEKAYPDIHREIVRRILEGELSACGIVRWQLMLAALYVKGVPPENLPVAYEDRWGLPGRHGWTIDQALSYLGLSSDEILEATSILRKRPSEFPRRIVV